ncbi:MAG TPA: DUF5666 domain-containing protein, partial [Acidimicrobiales bacterium]|nr:DUF5666 domain-containing protein [Acidimicrobiales bacterium]
DATNEPLGGGGVIANTVESGAPAGSSTVGAEGPAATGYGMPPGFSPPAGGHEPPPGYAWGGWPAPGPWGQAQPVATEPRGRAGRVLRSATTAWIVAGVLALAVVGLSIALSSSTTRTVRISVPSGGLGSGGAAGLAPGTGSTFGGTGSPNGSGPNGGGFFGSGVFGTVASVGTGTFTVTDVSGQTVTVDEQSSTIYDSGRTSASSTAVVAGARVAVQGTRSGNTVTATRVIVLPSAGLPSGGLGTAPAS